MPVPNFLAGVLIALFLNTWAELLFGCVVWAFVYCAFRWFIGGQRVEKAEAYYQASDKHLLLQSPILTFYAIEWATAVTIALLFAALAFEFRKMLF